MNDETKLLTCVMSCFNEEKTVGRAIESILNQTYTNFDFIIIDDCSTDNTLKVLYNYASSDDRIKILENTQNSGLAFSLNKGIKKATTRYIARMDADDLSLPERFETQMKFLTENKSVHVLGCSAILVDTSLKQLGEKMMPETHNDIIEIRYKNSLFIHPSIIARKSFFEKNNFYDESLKRAQDADLWLRGMNTAIYHNLQIPLIRYTVRKKTGFNTLRYTSPVNWANMKRNKELLSKGYIIFYSCLRYILINIGFSKGEYRGKYAPKGKRMYSTLL